VLLATGVVDELPLAIYGRGEQGMALALELSLWSRDLALCSDGPAELSEHARGRD
jgi:hypothetical protein